MQTRLRYMSLAVFIFVSCVIAAAQSAPGLHEVTWYPLPADDTPAVTRPARHIVIPQLPEAPTIDGRVEAAEWSAAVVAENWHLSSGEAVAPLQTTAYLGIHGGRLYLGFRCEEPNTGAIRSEVTEDGGRVWTDDDIEVFIDGNRDCATFCQIIINSIGTVTTLGNNLDEWTPAIERATDVGESAWFAEISVPIESLGISASEIGLNLCRERYAGEGDVELSCWNPTGGSFTVPQRFGVATLPGQHLHLFHPGRGLVGENTATVMMQNPSEDTLHARVVLQWQQGKDAWSKVQSDDLTFEPGAKHSVSLSYTVVRVGEPVTLRLSAVDDSGETIFRCERQQPVSGGFSVSLGQHLFLPDEDEVYLRVNIDVSRKHAGRRDLLVALCSEPSGLPVFVETVDCILPGIVVAKMVFGDIPAGRYSLRAVLREHRGGISRVAEDREFMRMLPPVE